MGIKYFYSRFFKDLKNIKNDLTIVVDPKLTKYLASSFPELNFRIEVSSKTFESHIPLGDLPIYLLTIFQMFMQGLDPILR